MVAAGMGAKPAECETHHLLSLSPSQDQGQLELQFLQAGLDPSAAEFGEYLSINVHKAIHNPKPGNISWGSGGAWNYQWKSFFEDSTRAKTPEGIRNFLTQLRDLIDNHYGPIDQMAWPYVPSS